MEDLRIRYYNDYVNKNNIEDIKVDGYNFVESQNIYQNYRKTKNYQI